MYGEVLRELQVLCVILASSDVAREYSIVGSQLVTRHCSAKNWIPTPTSRDERQSRADDSERVPVADDRITPYGYVP